MLQIIGWLGCVYLLVKAFEIGGSLNHKTNDNKFTDGAAWAIALASVGAIGFAIWILIQGSAAQNLAGPALSGYDTKSDSMASAEADAQANADAIGAAVHTAAADAATATSRR